MKVEWSTYRFVRSLDILVAIRPLRLFHHLHHLDHLLAECREFFAHFLPHFLAYLLSDLLSYLMSNLSSQLHHIASIMLDIFLDFHELHLEIHCKLVKLNIDLIDLFLYERVASTFGIDAQFVWQIIDFLVENVDDLRSLLVILIDKQLLLFLDFLPLDFLLTCWCSVALLFDDFL